MDSHPRLKSINKALLVLSALQDAATPLRLTEISRRTGFPKSTTHRMLSALTSSGMVVHVGSHYRATESPTTSQPSPKTSCELLRRLAPFLGDLLIRTGLSAGMAVLAGTDVEFVHRVYSHHDVPSPSDRTGRCAAWQTAAGRVLLAFDEAAALRVIQEVALPPGGANELLGELVRIRQNRFSEMRNPAGTTCLAVPLWLPHLPTTALVVKGVSTQVDRGRALLWLRRVSEVATREARRAA